MNRVQIMLAMMLFTSMAGSCLGSNGQGSQKGDSDLDDRIWKLEKELQELKKATEQQGAKVITEPRVRATAGTKAIAPWKLTPEATSKKEQLSDAPIQKASPKDKPEATEKKEQPSNAPIRTASPKNMTESPSSEKVLTKGTPVWSNLDIQLYGYIKLDAAYDTDRSSAGNFMRWVDSDLYNKGHDSQFNMTINQTRLGARISGPENNGLKTSGRVEVDFYGNGTAENKAGLMMRHAYMTLDWPDERFSVLAGQASDVISPLVPGTMSYVVAWWAGNIGYRRPQIRLTKSAALGVDSDLKLEVAAARTIGGGDSTAWTDDGGEDAGHPGVQSRASVNLPLGGCKPSTVGVSAHWAKEEYDTNASGASQRKYDSWSFNIDMTQPVSKTLTIKGEFFTGENLSANWAA